MIDWGNFNAFFSTGVPSTVLYTSPMIMAAAIIVGVVWFVTIKKSKHKEALLQYVLWVLFAEYLFVLFCSTVICRGAQSFTYAKLELTPFWTYWAAIKHIPGVSVWDIILNVVLFMPLGFLVTLLFPKITWWKVLMIAMALSIIIETNQYFFEKGIAQIDDVMHNTIGAIIGWLIARGCIRLMDKCNSKL